MSGFTNPIIRHKYTADPTALVVDKRIYLFTGHDEPMAGQEDYVMNEWLCFSGSDLNVWSEHPSPLKALDFSWSSGGAFATKIVQHNNQFFWFVSTNHKSGGTAIGVAKSVSPISGFRDATGKALITVADVPPTSNEKINLDPSVLIDDNGEAYLFWGNKRCHFAKLHSDLSGIDGTVSVIDLPQFEEGAHIHKRRGWYYLSYGYGFPEKVGYAMSRNIKGPWQFMGILNEIPFRCDTNRPCIIDYEGESWFFYHNGALENGGSHRRSVCLDRLFYNDDGSLQPVKMTLEE